MAEKKLSLVIAGGVSLGAYEAGVLTELLYALEHLNREPGGDTYTIDVMTGASAGSITAALVARLLLHDYEANRGLLHDAWVRRADIDHILGGEAPPGSLLSNDFQRSLIDQLLLGTEAFPLAVRNPAAAAPDRLLMAFTIANMVGVDYGLPYAQAAGATSKEFPATFFSDLHEIELDAANVDGDFWNAIGDAALASGSFPLAFPPYFLPRRREQYAGALASSVEHLPADQLFVDGGLFNNEPLKPCIELSARQDRGALSEDRIFLLIDPNLNTSKVDTRFLAHQDLVANATRLLTMSTGEMTARDWLRVDRINTELEWRDSLVAELTRVAAELPAATLDRGLAKLRAETEAIRTRKRQTRALEEGYLGRKFEEIESYHRGAFAAIAGADAAASRRDWLRRMVFVLDNAAGLSSKSPLKSLHVIGSEKGFVAGDHFAAFAGFFEEVWREHDYRQGRTAAHERLPGILGLAEPYPREGGAARPNPRYDPDPSWPPDLAQVEISHAPRRKRVRFRDVVMDQLDGALRRPPLRLKWYLRWMAKLVIRKQLEKALGL